MPSLARAPTRNVTARSTGLAEPLVAGQGVGLAERQGGHRVAVHADGPAPAPQVAVGLLLQEQEVEPLAHGLGVLAVDLGVARAEVGQERQAGQRGVGLPVDALAEAGLAGGAVDGVVVVALDRGAVVVPGGRAVPAAVGVLVAGEPVERALRRPARWPGWRRRAGPARSGWGRAANGRPRGRRSSGGRRSSPGPRGVAGGCRG